MNCLTENQSDSNSNSVMRKFWQWAFIIIWRNCMNNVLENGVYKSFYFVMDQYNCYRKVVKWKETSVWLFYFIFSNMNKLMQCISITIEWWDKLRSFCKVSNSLWPCSEDDPDQWFSIFSLMAVHNEKSIRFSIIEMNFVEKIRTKLIKNILEILKEKHWYWGSREVKCVRKSNYLCCELMVILLFFV